MKILKNSRQMPKEEKYMANKLYSDIVYAWFQTNSEFDAEHGIHWINRKDVVFKNIGEQLGITRQTASTKFKRLLDTTPGGLGLISLNEELDRYELKVLPKTAAMLIEADTLRIMASALNENSINVYIYLLNRYLANHESSFTFSLGQVKSAIGIANKTSSNNYVITDILFVLNKLDLLDYEMVDQGTKTYYSIKWMKNRTTKKNEQELQSWKMSVNR